MSVCAGCRSSHSLSPSFQRNHVLALLLAWALRLSGSLSRFPRLHAIHPWGFSFITQNSISYLRPMKITVQHQSPGLSFLSSHSPSQYVIYQVMLPASMSPKLGYVLEGKKCATGRSFRAEGEGGCSSGTSAGWIVIPQCADGLGDRFVCNWQTKIK